MTEPSSRERHIIVAIVAAALLLMAASIAMLWQPAPPKVVVMSTGAQDGAYHAFGQRYQQVLARTGVQLVLKPSAGAAENLARLREGQGGVSVALVQGGIVKPGEADGVESLGGMFLEPMWVFHRLPGKLDHLSDLGGRRIAVGQPGSGTRLLAQEVLSQNLAGKAQPQFVEIGGLAAAQALQDGEVDLAIFVSAPEGAAVQRLLGTPGVQLMNFRRAEAYTRRLPYLTRLELPEGAIDLARNFPPADTTLVAPTASLLVRSDVHPVVAELLLDAAREVHGRGGVLWHPGRFPSPEVHEYPLSPDAEANYKNGPSALRRYLPYWSVAWIQRLIFFGVPVLAIGLPLIRVLPGVYRWRVRRRVYRWYGELAFIERELKLGHGDREAQRRRLASIDARIGALRVPPAFGGEAYALKMHLQMVARQLHESPPPAPPPPPAGGPA